MAYGTIKVDTITFTDAGIDKSVTISGLVQNPTFTGNVTVTGTVSGATANFVSGVFTTQISGATVTGGNANFTSGTFTNISGGVYTITSGVFALGTSGTPSISFVSDPNTGIYSPGADQVAISTNGTGRLFVDASGNVSIGFSSASAPIYLRRDQAAATYIMVDNVGSVGASTSAGFALAEAGVAQGFLRLLRDGSGAIQLYNAGAYPLTFGTNNTEQMRLDSSGRLGLGTSSPSFLLDANSGSTASAGRFLSTSTTSYSATSYNGGSARLTLYGGSATGSFTGTQYSHGGSVETFFGVVQNSSNLGDFVFQGFNGSAYAERLRINSSGNVGIGTTDPGSYGANLAVLGSGNGIISVGQATSHTTLQSNGQDFYINAKGTGSTVFRRGSGDTESARLDSSGRLLVGTSSDSGGALLQVNGDRVRIATAKTPASASDTGTTGEICWDANYIYVCTATNTWKRSAISTW
jgi:hypothetical protein